MYVVLFFVDRCLWCNLNFKIKIEFLGYFIFFYEDMLILESDFFVKDEDFLCTVDEEGLGVSEEGVFIDIVGVLDLIKFRVIVERNLDVMYINVVDLFFNKLEDGDEALDLFNFKKNLVVNEINVFSVDNRF